MPLLIFKLKHMHIQWKLYSSSSILGSRVWFIRIFCDQNFCNFIDFQPDFVCYSPILGYFAGFLLLSGFFLKSYNHTPVGWNYFSCTLCQSFICRIGKNTYRQIKRIYCKEIHSLSDWFCQILTHFEVNQSTHLNLRVLIFYTWITMQCDLFYNLYQNHWYPLTCYVVQVTSHY